LRLNKRMAGMLSISILIVFNQACRSQQEKNQVCFKNKCVDVELALTREQQSKGLQFRERLDEHGGMLFIFQKSRVHRFWMKDTLIPLDMIWLDYSRRVVYIQENAQPCIKMPCKDYGPAQEVLYVLELNAFYSSQLNLKIGDTLTFRINEY